MLRTMKPHHTVLAGYGWMSLAVFIWASWLVLTSSGRVTALSVVDLAGFRAMIPAIVLAPLLWRHREHVARLGLRRCLLLSAYGAPFTLCVGYGLSFAPVAHAGAMVPGLMPVFAIGLGATFFGQRVCRRDGIVCLFILSGAGTIVWHTSGASEGETVWIGHVLFLAGALFWACFTVTVAQSDVRPFLATAIVAVLPVLLLAPAWAFLDASRIGTAEPSDIMFQAVFQGVVSDLVSLFSFGRALQLIGGRAATLSALAPGVATLLAIPTLGETPQGVELAALMLVVLGHFVRAMGATRTSTQADHQTSRGRG
ncbi:MAG: DMT family transporter [Pseudomonadota bacterium]